MRSWILSLPVEKEHNLYTSAEFFNTTLIFMYESYFLIVKYFSLSKVKMTVKLSNVYFISRLLIQILHEQFMVI